MAKKTLQQRTAVAFSREQGNEVFADSGTAVEALQVALGDAEASHTARLTLAVARWIVLGADLANWWKRIYLVFGPQAHRFRQARVEALYAREQLEQIEAGVEKAQAALRRADLPEVIRVGRAAQDQAARLGDVVGLLGRLTSANHTTSDCERYYRELEGLLANEYRAFASRENYPREADAYAELHKVFARCSELRLAPRLAKRNICAVAGGFSSGKSSFLNALIGERILPTNITPTTSIPTYIFHVDDELSVEAFNHLGGGVPIDASMFKKMTHDFKRYHGVELKRLVHRVSICTPKLQHWKNLALIDTPGYTNPEDNAAGGADGGEQRDEDIALANVLKSQFLIWVVDCEKGTLPEQDIHFIRKFIDERPEGAENKLYLVFNKGDKKTQEDRLGILQVAEETAKTHAIPFAGIGIYSSHDNDGNGRWYAHQGSPFDGFLEAVDQAQSSGTHDLGDAVQEVFQDYIDYHEQEGKQLGNASGLLDALWLALEPLNKRGGHIEDLSASLNKRRAYIRNVREDHGKLRDEARHLQQRFAAAVTGFVERIGTSTDPQ